MLVAVIDSNKNKQLWSKSILSLAAISEHIKFTVSAGSLSLSAVNTAKSSHALITFQETYFHEYSTDFTRVMSEGFSPQDQSYSFLSNSKHLATLFKNLDANDLNYIVFKVYWSVDSPNALKYKLLIEIKTKKLIVKKYQTNYQPVAPNPVGIASIYKKALHSQDSSYAGPNRINFITIEQLIPKQFLDMIPVSTESFKIEVKLDKISFSGFTKQILKDREYLKQPMAVAITLNLNELTSSNLQFLTDTKHAESQSSAESIKKSISFRLKDFKNFMNLINSFNASHSSSSDQNEYINLDGDDYFDIYFRNAGDPVLFELQSNPHVQIQFIQMTSDDSTETSPNQVPIKDLNFALKAHVVEKINKTPPSQIQNSVALPRLGIPASTLINKQTKKLGRLPAEAGFSTPKPIRNTDSHYEDPSSSVSHDYVVTYGGAPKKQKVAQPDLETDYSDSETSDTDNILNSNGVTQRNSEPYLGPTQLDNKPKSIFD